MDDQAATPATSRDDELRRALGTWSLVASIFSITVGSGIFRLPSAAAASLGAAAPVAYVTCAVAIGLVVLCFAEAGSRVPRTGGPYAYVERVFGGYAGWISGLLNWIAGGVFAAAAVTVALTGIIADLFPALGGTLGRTILILTLLVLPAWANVRGVRAGGRLTTVASALKLLPLLAFVVAGVFFVRADALRWTTAPSFHAVTRTSALLIFAFMGLEGALVPSGEVRDPERTVPRALFIAMGGIVILYVAVQLVAQGILGDRLAGAEAPLSAAAGAALGPAGRAVLGIAAATSMAGYLAAVTLSYPRALFAFAKDGLLPRALATVDARTGAPARAIWTQQVIVGALALSGTFEGLARVANVSALLLYLVCCAASWELRRRDIRESGEPFQMPSGGVVPVLAIIVIVWLLTGANGLDLLAAAVLIVLATPVYMLARGTMAPRTRMPWT